MEHLKILKLMYTVQVYSTNNAKKNGNVFGKWQCAGIEHLNNNILFFCRDIKSYDLLAFCIQTILIFQNKCTCIVT